MVRRRENLGKYLKTLLKAVFYYSGIYRMLIYFHRDRIPILMIHGVLDESQEVMWTPGWRRLSSRQLENGLNVLRRYFVFVTIGEVSKLVRGKQVPNRPVIALTFDDGYQNSISDAFPVLERFNVPGMVYLSTSHVLEQIPMWIDRLDYLLQQQGKKVVKIEIASLRFEIKTEPREAYLNDFKRFRLAVKSEFSDDLILLHNLEKLMSRLDATAFSKLESIYYVDKVAKILEGDEIRSASSLLTFGSHTVNHLRVDRLRKEQLVFEIRESRKQIEALTSSSCTHFCYPNGNFCPDAQQALRIAGYETAVTVENGANKIGDSEPLALRRFSFPNASREAEIVHDIVVNLLMAKSLEDQGADTAQR
jgi:peptidoglycan/xylan/chitin deacetylase (PgdA/CDA1 family)